MRKTLLSALFVVAGLASYGQKIPNPKPFAQTITAAELKEHLYIIAGPEMQGRNTASEGERKAAAYIIENFKKIGLQPGYHGEWKMPFSVYQDSVTKTEIVVNGKTFEAHKDVAVFGSTANPSKLYASEVVFIGNATPDAVKKANVKGKVVLVNPAPEAPAAQNQQQPRMRRMPGMEVYQAAADNGAAAVLVVNANFPRNPTPAVGNMTMNAFRSSFGPNMFFVSDKVAEAIVGSNYATAKNNSEPVTVKTQLKVEFDKVWNELTAYNVLGFLEGTDLKDEYLVITAHYDHVGVQGKDIYYGADDDGSGTVAVLEIAQAFAEAKKQGKGPRRSILFMLVTGEEKGLWGSAYYGENPVYSLEKTTANLNIDMIGRIDPERTYGDSTNYVYIVGDDKLSTDLRPISVAANKKYTKLELDYKFNDPNDPMRIYFRSDHYNFAKHGVPIIFYFNGTHADYHRPTDTPDKINYPLLAKRAQLVFYTGWEMANRNEMLKRDLELDVPAR